MEISDEKMNRNLNDIDIQRVLLEEFHLNKIRTENATTLIYELERCKICEDDATGIHFGVQTCEACKGFFKRSVHKYKEYSCRDNQNCKILPRKTKKCKYCRWMKCLKEGMSYEKVRLGRIPNSMKKEISKDSSEKLENSDNKENSKLNSMNIAKYVPKTFRSEIILKSSNVNQMIVLNMLRDKSYQILIENRKEFEYSQRRARDLIESHSSSPKYDFTPEFMKSLNDNYFMYLKRNAYSSMNILKELPGFQRLDQKDINKILNSSFFSILGVRVYRLYINNECYVMIDDKIQMSKELSKIFFGKEMCEFMFDFAFKTISLNLTDGELGLLLPFYLSRFVENAEGREILREINEYYSRALYNEFMMNKRSTQFIEKFIEIMCVLPEVNKTYLGIAFKPNSNEVEFPNEMEIA